MADQLLTGNTQIEKTFAFEANDFDLSSSNVLSLKNKTSYWTAQATKFKPHDSGDGWTFGTTSTTGLAYEWSSGTTNIYCPVELPHGAIITACIVYGGQSSGTGTWALVRVETDGGATSEIGTANIAAEDTSITTATVDNENYSYYIDVDLSGTADFRVTGARITYTTDYD